MNRSNDQRLRLPLRFRARARLDQLVLGDVVDDLLLPTLDVLQEAPQGGLGGKRLGGLPEQRVRGLPHLFGGRFVASGRPERRARRGDLPVGVETVDDRAVDGGEAGAPGRGGDPPALLRPALPVEAGEAAGQRGERRRIRAAHGDVL